MVSWGELSLVAWDGVLAAHPLSVHIWAEAAVAGGLAAAAEGLGETFPLGQVEVVEGPASST